MVWTQLSTLQQVFWVLAVLGSVFFGVSSLLSFAGVGDADAGLDAGLDADVSTDLDTSSNGAGHEALEYLSLRNLLAFALGFGWTGVLFAPALGALSLLVAVPAGLAFGWANIRLTRSLHGLESSGNANPYDAIGQDARVSVRIDPRRSSSGKVVVRVRDRELELLAVTEDASALNRGERVQVYGVENGHLLVSRDDKLGIRAL